MEFDKPQIFIIRDCWWVFVHPSELWLPKCQLGPYREYETALEKAALWEAYVMTAAC